MAERRSSRPKKALKYSAFEELSDDDFADSTPPPPKKLKVLKSTDKKDVTSNKKKEVSSNQTVADVYEPDGGRKRRVPVSDKVYERELQQALEISLLHSQGSHVFSSMPADLDTKKTRINTDLAQGKEIKDKENEPTKSHVKKVPGVIVEEKIEVMEDKEGKSDNIGRGSSRRCREKQDKPKVATVKDKQRLESDDETGDDDDYSSDEEDESVEEEESDDGSDFGHNSKPAKQKKTPVKNVKTVKPQQRETGKVKSLKSPCSKAKAVLPAPSKSPGPSSLPKAATSTAKITNQLTSLSPSVPASLTSNWKPPAFSSPGSSNLSVMKSPTSGLRLGLSRNQRVKSLHPSVHVT